MSDRQQDQARQGCESCHDVSESSPKQDLPEVRSLETALTAVAVPFQLIADFAVEISTPAKYLQRPELTTQERDLFLFVLTTPEVLNQMCRLAIICDLNVNPGGYFEKTFMGPDPQDILDCILPYLPVDVAKYWKELRHQNYGRFSHWITGMFMEFRSSLKRTVIEDMTTGEAIPLRVCMRLGATA